MAQILIINDDRQARLGLRWILECEGYQVLDYNGENHAEALGSSPVDLIITDVVAVDEACSKKATKLMGGVSEVKITTISRPHSLHSRYYLQVTDAKTARTLVRPFSHENLLAVVKMLLN